MALVSKVKAAVRIAARPLHDSREKREKSPLYGAIHTNLDPELHVREAAAWLMRAQDTGADRGVAYGTNFGEGFAVSYPETTGYIITTFLDLARRYADDNFRSRAVEMGEWESAIQLSSGAVMGGMYNTTPTPAVFNTGMVLLGWAALYRETASDRFAASGERAGRWLLEMQEPDGNWIRGNSEFADRQTTIYNVKAAWGLAEMGAALGRQDFIAAAVRNAEFAVSRQHPNGWFADCCLEDGQRPLLHTIAYTLQGLVGIGKISGRRDLIDAAARTARSLLALMDSEGFIPGTIKSDFTGAAGWCCVTGTAQTSIVWSELERIAGDTSYGKAAALANRYLMARHDIANPDPSIRGGVPGSWPVWGAYGKFMILNWATKFFIDALLLRISGSPAAPQA
jgi:hypothetical protein